MKWYPLSSNNDLIM